MSTWDSGSQTTSCLLGSVPRGLGKFTSAITYGCHWKAERAPRTTSVVSQGVGMHWESPKGLVNRLQSRPCGWAWPHSLFLMSLRNAGSLASRTH